MDVDAVSVALRNYIQTYRAQLAQVPVIQSQLLELGAFILAAEHYRATGYTVTVTNLIRGEFRMKRTSRGRPWRFSWFTVSKGPRTAEIHANISVAGAYGVDSSRYVVDVGVCEQGAVPCEEDKTWVSVENHALRTFVEAKRLTIYPMLLAQFVGIVHEIKPEFLRPTIQNLSETGDFEPTLVTTGPWARSCEEIYRYYPKRGFRLRVIPNLDDTLARLRRGALPRSPFRV